MARSPKRWVACGDNHGDMAEPAAVDAFKRFVDRWKPHHRIHGGDAFDIRALRKGASDEEKAEGLRADVEAGLDFLRWYKPDVFLLGNHDWRLWHAAMEHRQHIIREHCGALVDQIETALPRTKIIEYGKRNYHRHGDHRFVHGVHSGIYAARQAAQTYGNVVQFHVHAPAYFPSPHIDGADGHSSGCLCKLDMDYNRTHANTLRQSHGWVYGLLLADGRLTVRHADIHAEGWI